jgi:hypothetical protein
VGDDRLCAAQPDPASYRGCRLARHRGRRSLGGDTAIARRGADTADAPARHFAGPPSLPGRPAGCPHARPGRRLVRSARQERSTTLHSPRLRVSPAATRSRHAKDATSSTDPRAFSASASCARVVAPALRAASM